MPRKSPQKWTEDELKFLREHYWEGSPELLAEGCGGREMERIRQKAKKLGIRRRKEGVPQKHFHTRHDYFAVPSVRNSYWAGAIAADGNVTDKALRFYQSDESYVRLLMAELNYDGPLCPRLGRLCTKPNYMLTVYSRPLVDDLRNNYSIIPAKSLVLQPPNLTGVEALAFIAGYIDGDGYIGCERGYVRCSIAGTRQMMEWINDIFGNNWTLRAQFSSPNANFPSTRPIYILRAGNKKAITTLSAMKRIQEIADFLMPRKWDKVPCSSIQ